MKTIEIDDELYHFIAGQTKHIGESASDILRRLLLPATNAAEKRESPTAAKRAVKGAESVKGKTPAPAKNTQRTAPLSVTPVVTHGSGDILERLTEQVLSTYTKRVELFLYILAELYKIHGEAFANVEQIKGKNRIYFATSKDALLSTGSSTNPKAIPDSPYWVVTNNNTAKKIAMLEQVLTVLGYGDETSEAVIAKFA